MSLYRKSAASGASPGRFSRAAGLPIAWRKAQRTARFGGVLALALGFLAGCGKSGIEGELIHFRQGGHAVAAFADSDPSSFGAKKCQGGTLDQIPALLCEFGSSDSAAAAQPAAERWGGDIGTVLVLRRGELLFAAADRNKADPNGKILVALAKSFRRTKSR